MAARFALLFFALPLLAQLSAQPIPFNPLDPIPQNPAVRSGQLDNGLTYLLIRNDRPDDRAELRLAVRAGSLQEDPDQLGIAHFVEHMAFNGSEHFKKNELIEYLESVGTRFGPDLNAYTSFGETVYILQARTDSLALLERGLLILEDWAGGVSFEPEEIDKERGVVVSEWRTRLSPDQRLQQQYFPILYQNSRFAERLPIGEPEVIQNANYSTVRRYYEDWYRPDLMAVVAVGDFDLDWMEKEVRQRFSSLIAPPNPRERKSYTVPGHPGTRFAIFSDKEAAFTRANIYFKHPEQPLETLADYRLYLARSLYNRMLNARLFELQQRMADPPFTFAYSGYGGDVGDRDVYTVSTFTAQGKVTEGLEAVLTETYRAFQHGFTPSELERAKSQMLSAAESAARELDKQESGRLAGGLVAHYLDEAPMPDPRQRFELYQALLPTIALDDIDPLPAQWLTEDNRTVVVTGPDKEDVPLPSREELLALLRAVEEAELEPYVDKVSQAPLLSADLSPVPVVDRTEIEDLGVTEVRLANGLRVVLKPTDFKNDEIRMSAFSPGGHSLYPDPLYESASTAAALVNLGGIGSFDLPALEKKLAGRQVSVGPYISELYEGLSGNSSVDDVETLLQLTYLYFTQPRKDSIALESFLNRQRSIVENMFANPYYYYAAIRSQIQYGDHPRRQMTTMDDLEKISLEDAFMVYKDRFADASDFTFVFVGSFSVDAILPLLQTYLGNLPVIEREESWRDVGAYLTGGVVDTMLVRGQAPKAIVDLLFHGPFDYAERQNRYNFYSMIDLMRIKLREAMREDQGGVYGVRLSGTASQNPRPMYRISLSFNSDPSEVDTLVQVALDVIARIKAEGPEEADLQKVKETQRQNRIEGLKENGFWLGQLTARYREGLSLDGIKLGTYEQYIDGLSAQAVQEAARKYFNLDQYMKLVLMPEEPPAEDP